jgi:hypothetical protein
VSATGSGRRAKLVAVDLESVFPHVRLQLIDMLRASGRSPQRDCAILPCRAPQVHSSIVDVADGHVRTIPDDFLCRTNIGEALRDFDWISRADGNNVERSDRFHMSSNFTRFHGGDTAGALGEPTRGRQEH